MAVDSPRSDFFKYVNIYLHIYPALCVHVHVAGALPAARRRRALHGLHGRQVIATRRGAVAERRPPTTALPRRIPAGRISPLLSTVVQSVMHEVTVELALCCAVL